MRDRIKAMRKLLVQKLGERMPGQDFGYMLTQRGMFSYTGLTPEQVERLQRDFGIYAVRSGRICVAALNSRNLDTVADAIAAVLRG